MIVKFGFGQFKGSGSEGVGWMIMELRFEKKKKWDGAHGG